MSSGIITVNPAAMLAAQNEAAAAARVKQEQRKPAIKPTKESQRSTRTSQRKTAQDDGRGTQLDREA